MNEHENDVSSQSQLTPKQVTWDDLDESLESNPKPKLVLLCENRQHWEAVSRLSDEFCLDDILCFVSDKSKLREWLFENIEDGFYRPSEMPMLLAVDIRPRLRIVDCAAAGYEFKEDAYAEVEIPWEAKPKLEHWRGGTLADLNQEAYSLNDELPYLADISAVEEEFERDLRAEGTWEQYRSGKLGIAEKGLRNRAILRGLQRWNWPQERSAEACIADCISKLRNCLMRHNDATGSNGPHVF